MYYQEFILLKTLPPVCMKYTASDDSRVVNKTLGKAECYICHVTLIKSCIISYKQTGNVLLYLKYHQNTVLWSF